jgi:hypothetical protein
MNTQIRHGISLPLMEHGSWTFMTGSMAPLAQQPEKDVQ